MVCNSISILRANKSSRLIFEASDIACLLSILYETQFVLTLPRIQFILRIHIYLYYTIRRNNRRYICFQESVWPDMRQRKACFMIITKHYPWACLSLSYITNLVCYTYCHWLFNPECQHIFGKQTGYIYTFSVSLIWAPKNNNNTVDKNRNIYASLNQYHNTE